MHTMQKLTFPETVPGEPDDAMVMMMMTELVMMMMMTMMTVMMMMSMVVRVLVMVMIDDCFFLLTGLYFKVITHCLK